MRLADAAVSDATNCVKSLMPWRAEAFFKTTM